MKTSRITAFAGIAAIVLASAAPGFAQQGSASCSQEIAQARAHIWRAQAAMDITHVAGTGKPASGRALASADVQQQGKASGAGRTLPQGEASGAGRTLPQGEASGAGRSLASSPALPQGQASGAGRTLPQGEASGAGRTLPQGEASGAGRALAAAPGFTPVSSASRVSKTANAQFRVLASNQDRKAFVETLNEQERTVLYQSLSSQDKKRLASVMSDQEQKGLSQKISDQETKAWAEKIASDRTGLSKKIQKARELARAAQELCKKGDSASATAKAKEAMDALK